jgi:hypothetical protein
VDGTLADSNPTGIIRSWMRESGSSHPTIPQIVMRRLAAHTCHEVVNLARAGWRGGQDLRYVLMSA